MRPLHYVFVTLLMAVAIGVGLELLGIAREDTQQWSL